METKTTETNEITEIVTQNEGIQKQIEDNSELQDLDKSNSDSKIIESNDIIENENINHESQSNDKSVDVNSVETMTTDSILLKKIVDYEAQISAYKQEIIELRKSKVDENKLKNDYTLLFDKYKSITNLHETIKNESSKEIEKLQIDNKLLKQQIENQRILLEKKSDHDNEFMNKINTFQNSITTYEKEIQELKQKYNIEHNMVESLKQDIKVCNSKLTEKETAYELLNTKYNSLLSGLKSHVYSNENESISTSVKNNDSSNSMEFYLSEIKKIEDLYTTKEASFIEIEKQWKLKENDYMNKNIQLNKELSDLNNTYLQYQSSSNLKLSQIQKQLSLITAEYEEYKLTYQLHDQTMTYTEYKKLEEKYNSLILQFKEKEDLYNNKMNETINNYKESEKSLQVCRERISSYEKQLMGIHEQEIAEETKRNLLKNKNPEEEAEEVIRRASVFKDCFIPTDSTSKVSQWNDPRVKNVISNLPLNAKQSFAAWYTNIIKPISDTNPITTCRLEGLDEPLYNSILGLLLPLLNTIPMLHMQGQSRKCYSYKYDLLISPIPLFSLPDAPATVISMTNEQIENQNNTKVHQENTPDLLLQSLTGLQTKEKSRRLWKWNN